MATVELKNVEKVFDKEKAVSDVSLTIPDGSFTVIVGPSGCGKSTTLRMLAGLEKPTGGEIRIDGKRVDHLAPGKRNIAMVFQNYALYPNMTVYDNISFYLKMKKWKKKEIQAKVAEVAGIVGLEHLLDRKPGSLSGGQRQRVALARAIVRKPAVFLMDEPLSNLDAKLRTQMRAELIRLHKQLKATFIYVTHDQTEAMTMGDQIVVMNEGVVQQIASPLQLYNQPVNRFVAQFIGTPSMNILTGEWAKTAANSVAFRNQENGLRLSKKPDDWSWSFNQQLDLGFRPEALQLGDVKPDEVSLLLEGTVAHVEILGSETVVYLNVGEQQVVGKLVGQVILASGQSITCHVPFSKCMFFETQSGERLYSESISVKGAIS
ncbi:ABC transporter ATP-binding protein [Paenactinomyces guangxiensis]|uniref:ABC transporter ATP-binding protein n=1 Tax=Paenactinomyces guangxiensis TaxID=1490290 RepID=A0A7W1WPS9_9BACL|nr:ABC transporter ATP-binding protein [Paenactinomyces guangxiensis]MBA4493836.1 ABC transporter ATP-binding protein [Paenactinomyces guangxiensis]MBH8591302.1 ABC transporter ATP-binding protein [Paenactinomyces guangxiensis]